MGTTPSKSSTTLVVTKEQEDVRYLGERYPFGDEELLRLYRCFSYLLKCPNRISFLTDWAVHMGGPQRCKPVQIAEHSILPPNFGDILNRVAFQNNSGGKDDEDGDVTCACASALPEVTEDSRMAATNGTNHYCCCCCCCTNTNQAGSQEEQSLLSKQPPSIPVDMVKLESFLEGASNCSRRGGRAALTMLYKCCCSASTETQEAAASTLLETGYRIAVACLYLQEAAINEDPERLQEYIPSLDDFKSPSLRALVRSLQDFSKARRSGGGGGGGGYSCNFENKDKDDDTFQFVSLEEFLEWSESTLPLLSSALSTLMHCIFFFDKPYPPSRTALLFPRIDNVSAFFQTPISPMLFSFSCMSAELGGNWHRLYTSESDGLSFNRLLLSLLGYGGPTLLVIRSTEGGVFGAFTASPWKEAGSFYGNSNCFLYATLPVTRVYRPKGSAAARNFMYCNSEARSKGYDGLAHGIGFGGSTEQPRLFIDESLDACVASAADLTFENGPLLAVNHHNNNHNHNFSRRSAAFDIDALEVWGVGGRDAVEQALGARRQQREIVAANIRKARKVDKAAFLEDFQSGMIESKAFQHRDQIRGRADVAIDETHTNAYVYEK